jgi:hypothetical protein
MNVIHQFRRIRLFGLPVGLAVGVLLASATVPAAAGDTPPVPEPIDPDAQAALSWSVPARYGASWNAWRSSSATYNPGFVTPKWSINLDVCTSRAVRRIERYTVVISGIGVNYRQKLDGKACQLRLHHLLPRQGLYRVEVVVHTALGASVTLTRFVDLRDYLIVSIGDSLASGEGVPDSPGAYSLRTNVFGEVTSAKAKRSVQWKDRRCHRSARSGPALTANAIENASPHTSVTFLSFACSGAEINHLYDERYKGAEPVGSTTLRPQIDAVKELVGSRGKRQIDALLITAGVNDLNFSDIIEACATNNNHRVGHGDCVTGFAASKGVNARLHKGYDKLADAVENRLPRVREVYINDYPNREFIGGGCGVLGASGVGIDNTEAEEMSTLGRSLDIEIERAARRHRDQRWNWVEELTTPFEPHAYCADWPGKSGAYAGRTGNSWFTYYETSWAQQGNKKGTAHPNRAGHHAFARMLGRAVVPNQSLKPFRRVTVVIDALRWIALGTGSPQTVEIHLLEFPRDFTGTTRTFSVPQTGEWTPVPAEVGTFKLPVFVTPASPRHATEVRLILSNIVPIHHTRADGYGAGQHELTHPNSPLSVRYHVDVESPDGLCC